MNDSDGALRRPLARCCNDLGPTDGGSTLIDVDRPHGSCRRHRLDEDGRRRRLGCALARTRQCFVPSGGRVPRCTRLPAATGVQTTTAVPALLGVSLPAPVSVPAQTAVVVPCCTFRPAAETGVGPGDCCSAPCYARLQDTFSPVLEEPLNVGFEDSAHVGRTATSPPTPRLAATEPEAVAVTVPVAPAPRSLVAACGPT